MSISTRIRCVLAVCDYFLFGLGGSLISLLIMPIQLIAPPNIARRWGCFLVRHSWKLMCLLLHTTRNLDLTIDNAKTLRHLRSRIVVANHPSLIDIVILASQIPNSVLMIKSKLMRWRIFRPIFSTLCIINDRGPQIFFDEASAALKQGFNVIIFPEGTRSTPGVAPRLQRGAFHLAAITGTPLVPIRITTSEPFLTKQTPWWYVGKHCPHFQLEVMPEIPAQTETNETKRRAQASALCHTFQQLIWPKH